MLIDVIHRIYAGYPIIAVNTVEEGRFAAALHACLAGNYQIFSIEEGGTLRQAGPNGELLKCREGLTFQDAFRFAADRATDNDEPKVLVVFDVQHRIKAAATYRALKNVASLLKQRDCHVILVAPLWGENLPEELRSDLTMLDFELPNADELRERLTAVSEGSRGATTVPGKAAEVERLTDAAKGLTLEQAENAYALSSTRLQKFDAETIRKQKMLTIKGYGFLEVFNPVAAASIGGLNSLKEFTLREIIPSMADPELAVRGILLVGVPGTGKSLVAKAMGAYLDRSVIRFDVSAMKGKYVGSSEENVRTAIRVVDAIGKSVVWIDEIEKAVGGHASSAQSDGGTTLGMVGILLSWMQERSSDTLIVATCNDFSKLPPELCRKGRFDEIFFVDLPSAPERAEIAKVHLDRFKIRADSLPEFIASRTDQFTGAEIEAAIKSAARRTSRKVNQSAMETAITEVNPIAKTNAEYITSLREFAKARFRIANTVHEDNAQSRVSRTLPKK